MDIISKRTRRAFAEYLVKFSVLRKIEDYFDDADISRIPLFLENICGERRSLVSEYYSSIAWNDWQHIAKIVSVYESIINDCESMIVKFAGTYNDEAAQYIEWKEKLLRFLKLDGFDFQNGKLTYKTNFPINNKSILESAKIINSNQLKLHIQRIENSIDSDPDLAIGSAKELLETVYKSLLDEMHIPYSKNCDLPQMTKMVAKELKLTPEDINDKAKGAEIIKRILSNLSTVASGIAEIRNLYGSGHGKGRQYSGLQPRHARLAVGVSTVVSSFIIETYEANKRLPSVEKNN